METQIKDIKSAQEVELVMPTLSLEAIDAEAANELTVQDADAFRMQQFSQEEMTQIKEFSEKIDFNDTNAIITYGAGAQQRLANFSEEALSQVRNKDMEEIGPMLSNLVATLRYDASDEKKGLLGGLLSKGRSKFESIRAHYEKVESSIEAISEKLEKHQQILLKDITTQDKLFENNKTYFKELTMYIAAGKIALDRARNEELPALKAKATESGLAEDAQAATDYSNMIERFEKRLHDLDLTRAVCLQNAPQIRLVQTNAIVLSDKIQSTIVNTIPMWKNQLVITLGLAHSKAALKAQREVTETTNDLLKKNAELLHQSTTEVAEENERGIIDIETLEHTNEELIATIDDLIKIQEEGRETRAEAEIKLLNIENNLKAKMIEVASKK